MVFASSRGQPEGARRVRWIATGLLILAVILYVLSRAFERRYPGLAVVAAFSEAAMVGALADWFAVVALFRHPLGLPIPHTAIIPRNKDRIADNLGSFISGNFLGRDAIMAELRNFNPAARLARWLATPEVARSAGLYGAQAIAFWLEAVEDSRVRQFLANAIVERLESLDFARLAGELLELLAEEGRHQQLLDKGIVVGRALLNRKAVRDILAARLQADFNAFLKAINLSNFIGRYAAKRVLSGLTRFLREIAADPEHVMRRKLDDFVSALATRLKEDPALRLRGREIRDEILKRPEVATYLEDLWARLRAWLREDVLSADSRVSFHIAAATLALGRQLAADPGMQSWINEQIERAAMPVVERNRDKVGRFIAAQVRRWDERHMVERLESNIGKDLQFIRINGTLVGGLVGVLLFGLTKLIGG